METLTITAFAKDTLEGLSATHKYLSSKYFYDAKGSRIFQDIMQMPEYYLTDCELEIFRNRKQEIFEAFTEQDARYNLIELGAGDGLKTKVLLSHLLYKKANFEYTPIDISEQAINNLVLDLEQKIPGIKINGKVGDYFHLIERISQYDHSKKIILFLGSNIGNFNKSQSLSFLNKLNSQMQSGDLLFIGFDLKKDQNIILKAYNDPHGHTAAFNLNLLQRINNELNANFNLDNFRHVEVYDPESGTAKSKLISLKKQEIIIYDLNKIISFEQGESIFMEVSQKYDMEMIMDIANKSGFEIVRNLYDKRQYFVNSLWKLK
ncbi:MAG: L-histidine N(alpha)-methyltransferase [Bacteroidota bacterium]|nr:L-histidine N(alpha)-methyltransferase [Bacteroidota bacterium]